MKTPKGRSRSNSAAWPWRTTCPRASARSRSSASSLLLPIPGSPSIARQPGPPVSNASSAASIRSSSCSRPTSVSPDGTIAAASIERNSRVSVEGSPLMFRDACGARLTPVTQQSHLQEESHACQAEHRHQTGPLERRPSQDRDPRMAGLRSRRLRPHGQRHVRETDPLLRRSDRRQRRRGGAHPRRRRDAADRGDRPDPERGRDRRRSWLRSDDRRHGQRSRGDQARD